AMKGSSFYKLPPVLQWFSGNIGFHHIHHLSPRIPNYLLPQCHEENPPLQGAVVLTLRTGIRSMILTLWDEEEKKLISFRDLSRKLAANSQTAEVIGHSNVQSAYAD
ncbi:MAG: fatty acid desaturase, partial [Abitibacteriaceae bacterium]|nr:fatty acid desaturase [Abditibacteriaceae bacterium]